MLYGSSTGTGISYGYDTAKRMTSETTFGHTMTYGYDASNNRNKVSWPDTNYVSYDIDGLNRLTYIRENGASSGAGVLMNYAWDPLSRRQGITRGNATSTAFTYDAASRLMTLGQDMAGTSQDLSLSFTYTSGLSARR